MLSRKTYDNRTRDAFARDAGIDIDDARPSTWDMFHDIEVTDLKKSVMDLSSYCDEWRAMYRRATHKIGVWKLVALLGWGCFGIALVSRIFR